MHMSGQCGKTFARLQATDMSLDHARVERGSQMRD
jgi:hypothetical protein